MPFKFYCRNCNQKLEAPKELYGAEIDCPQCAASLKVPDPEIMIEKQPEDLSKISMACPVCAFPALKMPSGSYGTAECPGCGSKIPLLKNTDVDNSELPVLEEYYITRRLGVGGAGSVYEARQVKLNNRSVAIKILSEELSSSWDISTEISALVRLSHPYIVRIFDVTHTDAIKGLVMELVTAPHCAPLSLRDIMTANNGTLPVEAAVKTAQTICNALDYAHRQNVLHLDLKPENILVDHLGMLRIMDFGIARLHEPPPATKPVKIRIKTLSDSDIYGTPGYIAPERYDLSVKAAPSMDVFSLGAILYEMLTGEVPGGRFQLPSEINPQMPKILDAVIESSLSFHAAKRYQTMAEMGEALSNTLKIIRAGGSQTSKHQHIDPPRVGDDTMRIRRPDLSVSNGVELSLDNGKVPEPKHRRFGAVTYILIGMLCAFIMVMASISLIKPSGEESEISPAPPRPLITNQITTPPAESITQNTAKKTLTAEEIYNNYLNLYWGNAAGRDAERAFAMLKQAADMKHPPAINRLAEMFFYEESGFKDDIQALKLFTEAAKLNDPRAIYNLGECSFYGLCGAKQDYAQAVKYYIAASDMGSPEATFALGRCYRDGKGVTANATRALLLFRQAAAQEYAPAREIIASLEPPSTVK
ncbi:MAG: protein kinase [Victivallales bacterium]|nr:protein kinase [Victivallales bacterium]